MNHCGRKRGHGGGSGGLGEFQVEVEGGGSKKLRAGAEDELKAFDRDFTNILR